jgi:hypothetical protein
MQLVKAVGTTQVDRPLVFSLQPEHLSSSNFIGISRGSVAELGTQMQLAVMLGLTTADHAAFDLADRAGKLLTGLHKKWSAA